MNFVFDYDRKLKKGIIQGDDLDSLREHFSVEDKTAYIRRLRFGRFIPSRKYCITPTGRFEVGMFPAINDYILSLQIPHKVVITDLLKDVIVPKYNFDVNTLSTLKIPLRDYQETAIKKCLMAGRGTIIIATAGGKTLICASLVKTIRDHNNSKTLIMVPNIQLVEQTYNDFLEYGISATEICKWSGNNKLDPNAGIIIVGTNILHSKNTDLNWLKCIDLLLIDECHHLKKDNEINKILKYINTNHIYGFTGTMPEEKIDQWNIIGKIGPILYSKNSSELRDEKYIADVSIKILKLSYTATPKYTKSLGFSDPTGMWEEENDFLYNNKFRNNLIATLCQKLDNNVLILVDRIDHGKELVQQISQLATNKKIYYIRGEVEVEDREQVRKVMENTNNVVCVAIAKIFSTGINIKNLHYIIFALAGKAKLKIIQSIGRGLRLHESKIKLVIFDIADNLIYGMRHLVKRLALYEKEKICYETRGISEGIRPV